MLPSPLLFLIALIASAFLVTGCDETTDDDSAPAGDDDVADDDDDDDDTTDDDDDDMTSAEGDFAAFEELLDALADAPDSSTQRTLAEAFFLQVHYGDGFPIAHEGTVTFCALLGSPPAGGVSLAGEHEGWIGESMQREGDIPFYWITVDWSSPPARPLYKFVHHENGGDAWHADPWARRYGYDEFGEYSLVSGGGGESHLERYLYFEADQLGNERTVRLYLPAGYDPGSSYPVLYMHDGQNLFDPGATFGEWEVDENLDTLIGSGSIQPVVVVGLDNTEARMDEYTHCVDDFGHGPMGGDSAAYADLVVNQLMPFVEGCYAVRTGAENTGILGSSLGGLVSFDIALNHPGVFGYVGGMSSTLGWGAYGDMGETMIELWASAGHQGMVLYLDSGGDVLDQCGDADGDGIHEDSNDADNYCVTLQMAHTLESLGYLYDVDLFHWWEPGAQHVEAAWAERLPLFLEGVFPMAFISNM